MSPFVHRVIPLTLLLTVLAGIQPIASAHRIRPDFGEVRSRILPSGKRVIEFCESEDDPRDCHPYGDPQGYTDEEWKEIESVCNFLGYYGGAINSGADTLTLGATAIGDFLAISAAVGVGLAAHSLDEKGLKTSGDELPGLDQGNDNYISHLGMRDFEHLDLGLQQCVRIYSRVSWFGCTVMEGNRNPFPFY